MTEIQERCATWQQDLQRMLAADDNDAAKALAIQIYSHFVKNIPGNGTFYEHADFAAVVGIIKDIEPLIPPAGILAVGAYVLMKRPGCPYDENRNERVEANDSTADVIRLFGLLAKHAMKGYTEAHVSTKVMHLLRQVLSQNAHSMTIEEMKPFLEISPEISWLGRDGMTLLNVFQGPETPYFEHETSLSNQGVNTVTNQALVALLYNNFDGGPDGGELDDVLTGQPLAGSFDELTLRLLQICEAGIKMDMRRTDVILVSQILERMAHIAKVEAGTERAQHYATAIQAVVQITLPITPNILDKNCIYRAQGNKRNPMADDGFYNFCTVKALTNTAVVLESPEAMAALEQFRYNVLLHLTHMSPTFHKHGKEYPYVDQQHIAALADLCTDALSAEGALQPLNRKGRLYLLQSMNHGPLRNKLLSGDLKMSKEVFGHDLGL
ncbi:hypothetical protein [Pseudomonas serbica]|uniref:hypothetical protein n=1 Tax=Pseudomonas serbica TaxID=2965074 RepID=UPI00237B7FC0|nr:hypothetical protein [Pseudomonas serbica]